MNTKFRLLAIALVVAIFSVQCTHNDSDIPKIPTTIEQNFKAGSSTHEGITLQYQESAIASSKAGKSALVVVLHGQYANGSDNKSQLRQDAMIRVWHHLNSNNIKSIMLAPQCPIKYAWDENPADLNRASMSECLKAMIDECIMKNPTIDTSRIYILGYSDANEPAGGGGVWRMLSDYTELFAAGMSVAADPDDSIVASNIAKTPLLSVKGVTDVHAVSTMLDTFGDWIRDAGGILREEVLHISSREDLCREAFSKELLDWVLNFSK